MADKISVAIATYNGEKYLREQLDSLYSQTIKPDEVVVVDDCSSDGTSMILEEYRQRYGLRFFINSNNLGVNRNFEKAIRNCTGDYIAISDQDDVWMPNKIETSLLKLKEIEKGKPACVTSKSIPVTKDLSRTKELKNMNDTFGLKQNILGELSSQGCTIMMNRQLVDSLSTFPSKEFMYDAYIGLLAACIGNRLNIGIPLMYYRHHENNVVARLDSNLNFIQRIALKIRKMKYSTLFDYRRFHNLEVLYAMHKNQMNIETVEFVQSLITYNKSNLWYKINYILKEDYFSTTKKVKLISGLIVTSIIPVSPTPLSK